MGGAQHARTVASMIILSIPRLPRLPSLHPRTLRAENAFAHLPLASLTWWFQFTVWSSVQDAFCLALSAIDASLIGALEIIRVGPLLGILVVQWRSRGCWVVLWLLHDATVG
jgi:hypothetical protein